MPNKPRPENRHRMVRVEDELWEAAKTVARSNNTTVSAVIRDCLTRYVRQSETAMSFHPGHILETGSDDDLDLG